MEKFIKHKFPHRTATWLAVALFLALALNVSLNHSALAQTTITVNTTTDELNTDGDCSLREAIQSANTDTVVDACPAGSGADIINIPAGTYTLAIAGGGENLNATGDLDLTADLTISGNGARNTIINGGGLDRVFHVANNGAYTINALTITSGVASEGGGLFVKFNFVGILNLNRLHVSANHSTAFGGGIYGNGTVNINDSTISNNTAGGGGGGMYSDSGTVTIINSTISGNSANEDNGGIRLWDSGTVINSTIVNNTADADNNGSGSGGGVGSNVVLQNTIVANNIDMGGEALDCGAPGGSRTSNNYNLIENTTGCSIVLQPNDISGVDPNLGGLQDNGGSTDTHALLTGSQAIDKIANSMNGCGTTLITDQRGIARPQGSACDIGAFEFMPTPGLSIPNAPLDASNGVFSVPVNFASDGASIASVGFALNYGESCLSFDETDSDSNGVPNAISGLPSGFNYSITHVVTDTAGELDISLFDDLAPIGSLSDGALLTVTFGVKPVCITTNGTITNVTVNFASSPPVSFGDPAAMDVPGTATGATIPLSFNATPTAIALSLNSVNENAVSGTTVGTLSTTDLDGGDSHTYTLVAGIGDTGNVSFTIAGNALKTAAVFNFETQSSYSVRIRTTDNGGLNGTFEQSFTISVNDLNETPTLLSLDNTSVNENAAVGATVGLLSSSDPDAGATHTYTLVSGTGDTDNASFTIAGNLVKTAAIFNFEVKNSYSVRIRTTDNGSLFLEQAFTISVNDINETPTVLNLSNASVNENAASGTTVGTLSTSDPDAGDSHTYTLVSGTGDTDNASFSIAGNLLKTAAVFNFEVKSSYSVLVRTTDSGTLFIEQAFTISVNNINDAPVAVNDAIDPLATIFLGGQAMVIDVLANDTDEDGNPLSVGALTQPASGSATNNTSNVSFTAPNSNGSSSFTYQASDGTLSSNSATVTASHVKNDVRGDCNSNGSVTAADFIATVLEIFDSGDTLHSGNPAWWLIYTGTYAGSPRGCDSNANQNGPNNTSQSVTAGDIICTVLTFFGRPCGSNQAVAASPAATAQVSVTDASATPGQVASVMVNLNPAGNSVAAVTFALKIDSSQLSFDATDADSDGVPDAVVLNIPASMSKSVSWNAAESRLEVAIFGTSLPLPTLNDGAVATVSFAVAGNATSGETELGLKLVTLSDTIGEDLAVEQTNGTLTITGGAAPTNFIFLPTVMH